MAKRRMDVLSGRKYMDREGVEKTAWTKVGVAWETESGGWAVRIHCIPVPEKETGEVCLLLAEPREKQERF